MGQVDDSSQEQLIKKFYTEEKFRNEIISRAKTNPQTYANMIGLGLFTGTGSMENPEVKPQ
jgi:Pyruvate/2-oxoacid:ferredoxin oxidoreductase gamma subunit